MESSCITFYGHVNQDKSEWHTYSECVNAGGSVLTSREPLFATEEALSLQRVSLKVLFWK